MSDQNASPSRTKKRAYQALRDALVRSGEAKVDAAGYVANYQQNLVSGVQADDFVADLEAGDGNELQTKFRAAHSSSALAVNTFAPFRNRMQDLDLGPRTVFESLEFERKCSAGIRGRRAPNLDVLLSNSTTVAGIESKCTEYLSKHSAKFSPAYCDQIKDQRSQHGWYDEMLRLIDMPNAYKWLDAAQLIKHAFGLSHTFPDRSVSLVYLYWEPTNTEVSSIFQEHRNETAELADRVKDRGGPCFSSMTYNELWAAWSEYGSERVQSHAASLRDRYSVSI